MEWKKDNYTVSTDKSRLSLDTVHGFLSQKSYWARERTREQVAKSFEGSICFGIYDGDEQAGFARVVTDYATFYWLCDVFVAEEYRGKGLGKWLIECVTGFDELKELKGLLATRDADGLYEQYGFKRVPADKTIFMRTNI